MEPKKLSQIIREKKKKMLEAEPELIDTAPTPDMNAQDVYDLMQKGRIEETLDTPPKINAENAELNEDANIGVTAEDKMRMVKLRKYIDDLDMW